MSGWAPIDKMNIIYNNIYVEATYFDPAHLYTNILGTFWYIF